MGGGIANLERPQNWGGVNYTPPVPVDPQAVQAALLARLKSLQAAGNPLQFVEVAAFPDRPKNYRLTHRVGAALLIYRGANYGPQLNSRYIVQDRTYEFEAAVLIRDLGWAYGGPDSGGTPGAYQIIEAIRAGLTGFRAPGCGKAYPERENYRDMDEDGVWLYTISFRVPTMATEEVAPPAYPTLTQATAKVSVAVDDTGAPQPSADSVEAVAGGGAAPKSPTN